MPRITQIPGTNKEIVEVRNHILEAIDSLMHAKAELISCADLAEARIKLGKESPVNLWNYYFAGENFNYLPNGDILVAKSRYSPVLRNLKEVHESFKNRIRNRQEFNIQEFYSNRPEFYLDKTSVEQLQDLAKENPADAIKSGVLLLKREDTRPINISSPDDNKLGVFLFENQLKPYCALCNGTKVSEIEVTTAKAEERAFARALFVPSTIMGELRGDVYDLSGDIRVSWVREIPAGQAAKVEGLDNILAALKAGRSFEHNGKMYVPVDPAVIKQDK